MQVSDPTTRSKEALEQPRLGRPCLEEDLSRNLSGGVAEGKDDHDHVVERSDDRQELGNEVDRRQDPQPGEANDHLGPSRDPGVPTQSPGHNHTGRKERSHVLEDPRRQAMSQEDEKRPRRHQRRHGHQRDPRHRVAPCRGCCPRRGPDEERARERDDAWGDDRDRGSDRRRGDSRDGITRLPLPIGRSNATQGVDARWCDGLALIGRGRRNL